MFDIPTELKYTKTHEWIQRDEDDLVTIGITHHAQRMLGDIVFVELPELEQELKVDEEFGVVESVKAASDLYCPLSGEVVSINEALLTNSALINRDPYHDGWIIRLKPDDIADWDELLDAKEYARLVELESKE